MATNDKRLRVTELDFDDIKTNLKTFLKGQTEFKDYDFEGSGMSVLLDLLAYNTHYLAFNANMLANEMFLDSSALRSSIVSHAKMLGYTPQSPTAPKATIDVTLNNTNLSSASITAGTKFSTTVNGTTYNFVSKSDVSTTSVDGVLKFSNLEIFEGTYVTNKYIASPSDVDQKFTIPSNRVDTSTLTVKVQDSATDTDTNTYTLATDITQITDTSTVYFLKEVENGEFEVEFGDGVIGKGLSEGNVVILQYVITNKDEANGASSFTAPSAISGVTDITVATVSNAAGGGEAESLASIKYNAPLDYATQGRAVTGSDYKVKVKDLFPAATTIQVWGGEDGNASSSTAEYGKVFISIKQSSGANLTTTQKTNIVDGLKKLKVASVTPVIVDPETTFIFVTTRFKYDSSETTKDVSDLVSDVTTTLQNFNTSELNKFDTVFRYSKVVALIDGTNKAIDSNITTIQLAQKFTPTLNSSTNYTLEFNNALYNPHSGHNSSSGGIVSSTGFNVGSDGNEYFFDDDGQGNLRRYYFVGSSRTYADNTAGTVTYSTGTVAINALNITGVSNVDGETSTQIRLVVKPDSNDVVSVRNNLLEIDFSNSSITGEIDTVSSGSSSAGTGYTTTSSYS
jgi:hypothetical protein